jgi:16S rRNA (guanine527-N7)-methyltransferase
VEHRQELHTLLISSAKKTGLAVGNTEAEQFMRYLAQLIEWNRTINLTSIIEPFEIIIKHFIDSLAALVATNFPERAIVLDVGSGGGFPGIPLKIMRPDLQLVLVEPVQKKCSFLNSVIGLLKLREISTFGGTIEQYAQKPTHPVVDMVVLRALKLEDIRKHVPALLASKGKVILYRADVIQDHEIDGDFNLISETTFFLPQESGKRVISVLGKNN